MPPTIQRPTLWTDDLPEGVTSGFRRSRERVAVDIETSGLAWQTDKIATVQVAGSNGVAHIVRVGAEPPRQLAQLIADPRIPKVFHHAMFDLRFMAHAWGLTPGNTACTKIASKLLRPTESTHSLKPMLARYLGVEVDKGMQLSDWFAPNLSDEQVAYAVGDVVYLHDLLAALTHELEQRGLMDLAHRCFDHIPTRVALELGGFPDVYKY